MKKPDIGSVDGACRWSFAALCGRPKGIGDNVTKAQLKGVVPHPMLASTSKHKKTTP